MKKFIYLLVLLCLPVLASGSISITTSDVITISGYALDSAGIDIQPDSVRIIVYHNGVEEHDAWYNNGDAQCNAQNTGLQFFDAFGDIDDDAGDGFYEVGAGFFDDGDSTYHWVYREYYLGGIVDTLQAVLDTLQNQDDWIATATGVTNVTDTVNAIIDTLQNQDNWVATAAAVTNVTDTTNAIIDTLQVWDDYIVDSLQAVLDSVTAILDTLQNHDDWVAAAAALTNVTDTVNAIIDTVQNQDDWVATATAVTNVTDTVNGIIDTVQAWSAEIAKIDGVMDTVNITRDSTQGTLDTMQAWSTEIAKVDGIMDTVNLIRDSVDALVSSAGGDNDSIYAIIDTLQAWQSEIDKIDGIMDTANITRDSTQAILDSVQNLADITPITDTLNALIDSIQNQDDWVATAAAVTNVTDTTNAIIDSLQAWSSEIAKLDGVMDTVNLIRDSVDAKVSAAGGDNDSIYAIIDTLQAWSAEIAKLDGVMDTVNLIRDSVDAKVSAAGGDNDSIYAIIDTLQAWSSEVAKVDGIMDTLNLVRDSVDAKVSAAGGDNDSIYAIIDTLQAWQAEVDKIDGIMDTVNITRDSTQASLDTLQNAASLGEVGGACADSVWHANFEAHDGTAGSFGDSAQGWSGSVASNWSNAQRDSVLAVIADAGKVGLTMDSVFALIDSIQAWSPEIDLINDVSLSGTADSGGSTMISLAGGSAVDNYYSGSLVRITGGTGVGQARTILSYNGTNHNATVTRDWETNPDNTSVFAVVAADVPAILEAGTATGGTSSQITLDANASAISATYASNAIAITAGTGIGQTRLIIAYNGGTKVATITPGWTTTPDATSVYQIFPSGRVDVGEWGGTTVGAGDIDSVLSAVARLDNAFVPADTNVNGDTIATQGTDQIMRLRGLHVRGTTANDTAAIFVGNAAGIGFFVQGGASAYGGYFLGGTDKAGLVGQGTGTGSGLLAAGGATGHGFRGTGGGTSGHGMYLTTTDGRGLYSIGTSGNAGIEGQGQGAGSGLLGIGGATGNGIRGLGGSSSGDGLSIAPQGTGSPISPAVASMFEDTIFESEDEIFNLRGLHIRGTTSGDTALIARGSGTNGYGIFGAAGTSGDGMKVVGGIGGGNGLYSLSNAAYGIYAHGSGTFAGIYARGGATNANAIDLFSSGTGVDISGEIVVSDTTRSGDTIAVKKDSLVYQGSASGLTAADVWNIAFSTGFDAGSMGDSLNNSSYVQGSAAGLTAADVADTLFNRDSAVFDAGYWHKIANRADSGTSSGLTAAEVGDTLLGRDSAAFGDGYWHKVANRADSGAAGSDSATVYAAATDAIYDALDTMAFSIAGPGPDTVVIYAIDSGATPDTVLQFVDITIKNAAGQGIAWPETDGDGKATFYLDSADYTVVGRLPGFHFDSYALDADTVDGNCDSVAFFGYDTQTPGFGTVYGYIYDINGNKIDGVEVCAVRAGAANATADTANTPIFVPLVSFCTDSDSTGYFAFDLMRRNQYPDTTLGFYNITGTYGGVPIFDVRRVHVPPSGTVDLGLILARRGD